MVDAKLLMATERNGHNGQIFEALRSRFPEIPEQVISNTLQAEVGRFLCGIWTIFGLLLSGIVRRQNECVIQMLLSLNFYSEDVLLPFLPSVRRGGVVL